MLAENLTIKVTLLSDLHIGSGATLLNGIDWITRPDGYTYIADSAQLLENVLARAVSVGKNEREVIRAITGLTLAELVDAGWLSTADFGQSAPLFRYRLRGEPATREVREQIKTVYGEPYLVGSTLKGALRTVIATAAARDLQPNVQVGALDGRRTWAARPVEQTLFGPDPNHDFLRLLQVSDSRPVAPDCLRLRRAHIYPTASVSDRGRSKGLDVDLEAVAKGTAFHLDLHIPVALLEKGNGDFEQRRHAELQDWERRRPWLSKLAVHGRNYARQLLIEEVTYFENKKDVPAVHRFYSELANRFSQLKKNEFVLPLGWGGGWHTKTLNQYLKQDANNFERIADKYRLDPTGDRKAGDRFPKSRHLLRQPDGQPGEPLGWVLVELNEAD